ncbi:MAG: peptidylprolyl isomerase [Candidatus Bathyarchaeota archaeon]|nr:peptidylprolyl isomerase [Candidatus Bathyarchaeum tardum]
MPSKSSRRRRPRKQKTNYTKIIAAVALLAVAAVIIGYVILNNDNPNPIDEEINNLTQMKVLFETSMGNITIQLRDDMPITTTNFKNLVHNGVYDGTLFHRVIADFMIQGGDPTTGNWSGGTIANIQDEFTSSNENNRGTIAMANFGEGYPNTGSSQFFINVVDNNYLDSLHPVFGEVIEGMDVVDTISNVDTDIDQNSETFNQPLDDVTIIKASLID